MADSKVTEPKSIIMGVVGVAISAVVLYGMVYFASKAWKKGQAS